MTPFERDVEELVNRHLGYPGQTFKVAWAGETTRPGGQTEYGVTGRWEKAAADPRGEEQVHPHPPGSGGKFQGFSKSVHAAAVMAQQPEVDHAMTLPLGLERLPGVNL